MPLCYTCMKKWGLTYPVINTTQSELPCKIQETMVTELEKKAAGKNIRVERISSADKLATLSGPLLAVDIESLVLGDKEHSYGVKSTNALPAIEITSAYIDKKSGNYTTKKHQCSYSGLSDFTPTSDITDLGGGNTSVCSATQKCLSKLSTDVIKWVEPQN